MCLYGIGWCLDIVIPELCISDPGLDVLMGLNGYIWIVG